MNNDIQNIGRFEIWGMWAPELKEAIVPLLEKYEPLLPPWCQIAHVSYMKNGDNTTADCGVDFDYRRLRFRFAEAFFAMTEAEQVAAFRHEFLHGYESHLCNVAGSLVKTLLPNDSDKVARSMALEQLRIAHEGVICDLTFLVGKLMDGPK